MEEMTSTIGEIAHNAEKRRTVIEKAVTESTATLKQVNELGKAADEIGKVMETITDIPEQTNLLALNATIEAAVEEQSATTSEIATNVAQASQGVQNVTRNVVDTSNVSQQITQDIADVTKLSNEMIAGDLSKLSEDLDVISREKISKGAVDLLSLPLLFHLKVIPA